MLILKKLSLSRVNPSHLDTFVVYISKTQKPGGLILAESAAAGIITAKISLHSFQDPASLKSPLLSAPRSFSGLKALGFKL